MTKFTYKQTEGLYDAEKLNDTAKVAFNYLLKYRLRFSA
jgi:hypothetical protein